MNAKAETVGADAIRSEIASLVTIRDVLRHAVSLYGEAGLHFGHGSATALDEAVFLILESLHLPIDDINPWLDARLTEREKTLLGGRIARRVAERVPAAYLTGRSWLGGLPFRCDARALVPRSYIAELFASPLFDGSGAPGALIADPQEVTSVLELCTGGGSLAILAARTFPNAAIDAIDISADALSLAAENVAEYGLEDRIALLKGDLFAPVAGRRYDLIIANPPYVGAETMAALPAEFRHEPALALDGGEDGFDLVHRILAGAAAHLNHGGALLCEIGDDAEVLEAHQPDLAFLWLDTEASEGEVFWIGRDDLSQDR
ncbi:MAG TPA: 50S ribosomal protein L3 N(5)-glutamine methyltransferase [Rhizobiaceae bacterium]|nr:50S ribosomal protein L3 N(5)-glutamine methyltransferase [Rhizobiaceae bacterium]